MENSKIRTPLQDEFFDFRGMFRIFLRGWWILLLGGVAGGLVALTTFETRAPIFSSTVKMFVQGGSDSVGITANDLDEGRRISQLYGDLATTRPILNAVAKSDDVPYTGVQLAGKISVQESRSFIEISVIDQDPDLAAVVANTTARTLISELAKRQIAQIAQFQISLAQLGLEDEVSVVATQAVNLPTLSVAENAFPSNLPISESGARTRRLFIGSILGLMLSGGLVVVLSALDNTVKTEDEVAESTGLLSLGIVPQYRPPENGSPIMSDGTGRNNQVSEAYDIIRANLDFALSVGDGFKSILITSPGPGEGKSALAANLAIAYAKGGDEVILVDTDMRRPVQHQMFGISLSDTGGVTDVLNGDVSIEDALSPTEIAGLRILTAGTVTVSEEISSLLRRDTLSKLKTRLNELAGIIIYDSPPTLMVSDPLILREGVDLTILVNEAGGTKRGSARRGAEAIARSRGGMVVTVLTKYRTGITGYGYDEYGYGVYYGIGQVRGGIVGRGKGALSRVISRAAFWKND